ncbi:glutamyl-tRNA synthetase [Gorgonomyces haynaldii]|nr:glutamyl-tRNA synthetase [Gorgonomyces haynaldii]
MTTRFAPSPTGFMHLGSLRTSLFNFLLAKQHQKQFILRIEDTDQTRLVPKAKESIISTLDWFKLKPDQLYVQSRRLAIYKQHVDMLLEKGHAYKCYCTPERLERLRKLPTRGFNGYDRYCLRLPEEERIKNKDLPYTVRFKVPRGKNVEYTDLVHGPVSFSYKSLDDLIIMKSDGYPTYHLANVVDDHLMGITHVLRGDEWISSTPKHILLYQAFGWQPPQFAHLPLLINKGGAKLSKRSKDASVSDLQDRFLPEALLNFCAFLGWSPQSTREFYRLDDLIKEFNISHLSKSPSVVSMDRLEYFNKLHIADQLKPGSKLLQDIQKQLQHMGIQVDQDHLFIYADAVKDRVRTLDQFPKLLKPFFVDPDLESDEAQKLLKSIPTEIDVKQLAFDLSVGLQDVDFEQDKIKGFVNQVAETKKMQYSSIMKTLRYKICGTSVGIDLLKTMELIGKETTIKRLHSV